MKRNSGLPNPEDPLQGLEDYWKPEEQFRSWFWWSAIWILIACIVIGLVLAFTLRNPGDWR